MLKQCSLTLMNCVRLLFSLPRGSGRCFGWISVKDETTAKTLRSLGGLGLILLLELRAVDVAEYVRRFEDSEHDSGVASCCSR